MKLQIASDLHLEFSREWRLPSAAADVLVLAGDIGTRASGLRAFATAARERPAVYVPGNHEYYGGNMADIGEEMRNHARDLGIHLLDNDELVLDGVRFLGATLWTDFDLFGEPGRTEAMRQAARHVVDYHVISFGAAGWLKPEQTRRLHLESLSWLTGKLSENFDGPTVVVTHHAPHRNSLHPRFAESPISPAFVSHLDSLMGQAAVWIHGHTHDSFDYRVGATRVICNPRGYDPFELNPDFNPRLTINI